MLVSSEFLAKLERPLREDLKVVDVKLRATSFEKPRIGGEV